MHRLTAVQVPGLHEGGQGTGVRNGVDGGCVDVVFEDLLGLDAGVLIHVRTDEVQFAVDEDAEHGAGDDDERQDRREDLPTGLFLQLGAFRHAELCAVLRRFLVEVGDLRFDVVELFLCGDELLILPGLVFQGLCIAHFGELVLQLFALLAKELLVFHDVFQFFFEKLAFFLVRDDQNGRLFRGDRLDDLGGIELRGVELGEPFAGLALDRVGGHQLRAGDLIALRGLLLELAAFVGREGRGLCLRLQLRFNTFASKLPGFPPGQHRVVLRLFIEVLERVFDVFFVLLLFFRRTERSLFGLFFCPGFRFGLRLCFRLRFGFRRSGSGPLGSDLSRGLRRCDIFF